VPAALIVYLLRINVIINGSRMRTNMASDLSFSEISHTFPRRQTNSACNGSQYYQQRKDHYVKDSYVHQIV
jgi:hypothetical protein